MGFLNIHDGLKARRTWLILLCVWLHDIGGVFKHAQRSTELLPIPQIGVSRPARMERGGRPQTRSIAARELRPRTRHAQRGTWTIRGVRPAVLGGRCRFEALANGQIRARQVQTRIESEPKGWELVLALDPTRNSVGAVALGSRQGRPAEGSDLATVDRVSIVRRLECGIRLTQPPQAYAVPRTTAVL